MALETFGPMSVSGDEVFGPNIISVIVIGEVFGPMSVSGDEVFGPNGISGGSVLPGFTPPPDGNRVYVRRSTRIVQVDLVNAEVKY